jgi:hypothetical protein
VMKERQLLTIDILTAMNNVRSIAADIIVRK